MLEMDRSMQRLIAAGTPESTRSAAVASIRAASLLDENLQRLYQELSNNKQVEELVKLNESIKAPRMDAIRAARSNDIAKAHERNASIGDNRKN